MLHRRKHIYLLIAYKSKEKKLKKQYFLIRIISDFCGYLEE